MACVSAETETDLMIAERGLPVVNFLDSADCPFDNNVPNCFHFSENAVFTRAPRIPVIVEGVWVPMLLDTGAEVTIVSSSFLQRLFPDREFPNQERKVRSLGGNHIAIKGPVTLTIEICGIALSHPVYYRENVPTFMLGYDVVSAVALDIDTESICVWSKLTV